MKASLTDPETMPWLASAREQVVSAWQQQRLPHGLLIHGTPGLGKLLLARWIATAVLCDDKTGGLRICGRCKSCQLLAAGTHPDFTLIQPEEDKQQISADQIREACVDLSMTSYRDGYKVAIVEPAQQMTLTAANSLLKTLEEPSRRTILILVAQRLSGVLPTLRSRCQQLAVRSPEYAAAEAWIAAATDQSVPRELLQLAEGAPLKAIDYASRDVEALVRDLETSVEALASGRGDVTQIAKRWIDDTLPERLLCLDSWLNQQVRRRLVGTDDRITGSPLLTDRGELNISRMFHCLDRVRELRAQLSRVSLQRELAVESLLLDVAGALRSNA